MTQPQPDPINELVELAGDVLDDRCSAITTALPDDPTTVLRPMVEAVLAEAAAQQWIDKQLAETGIRSMDFRNGMEMEMEPAREILAHWVAAARTMLGDAPNYTETKLSMDVKVAESPEMYTLVIQRHAVGALTPHEARLQAEQATADVLRIVADWVARAGRRDAADVADLTWLLDKAGHRLPETETSR